MKVYGIIFTLLFSILAADPRLSIHIRELMNHRDDIIPYSEIDSAASVENIRSTNRTLSREVIGYLPYWQYSQYPDLRYDLLTQINYFSAELDPLGNIVDDHNWQNLGFIQYAQQQGVKVKLCAVLFGSAQLTTLLSNPEHRQNAIDNLLNAVSSAGADGVDIDFELLPYSQRDNMVQFITDLTDAFHYYDPQYIVTMATPPVDWSGAWDYHALAQITDGLFIMGYNYHWSGSPSAGPVSPLGGFTYDLEFTVQDYLTYTDGNSAKLILGLPYYGYDWPVINGQIYSPTIGSATARTYSAAKNLAMNYGQSWDILSQTPWVAWEDDTWRQLWFDDSLSLAIKYQYAKDNDLAGVGIWALGYDSGTTELWGCLENQFTLCEPNGDFNGDGITNILDVISVVSGILSGTPFTDDQLCLVDMNVDGSVTVLDIIMIINRILG